MSQQHPLAATKPPGLYDRRKQITEQRCTRETMQAPKRLKLGSKCAISRKTHRTHLFICLLPFLILILSFAHHMLDFSSLSWEFYCAESPRELWNERRKPSVHMALVIITDTEIVDLKWEAAQIKFFVCDDYIAKRFIQLAREVQEVMISQESGLLVPR